MALFVCATLLVILLAILLAMGAYVGVSFAAIALCVLLFASGVQSQTNPVWVSHFYQAINAPFPLNGGGFTLTGKVVNNALVCFCNVKSGAVSTLVTRVRVGGTPIPIVSITRFPTGGSPTNTLVAFMTAVTSSPMNVVVDPGNGASGEMHCDEFAGALGLEHHGRSATSFSGFAASASLTVVCPFNVLVFGGFAGVAGTKGTAFFSTDASATVTATSSFSQPGGTAFAKMAGTESIPLGVTVGFQWGATVQSGIAVVGVSGCAPTVDAVATCPLGVPACTCAGSFCQTDLALPPISQSTSLSLSAFSNLQSAIDLAPTAVVTVNVSSTYAGPMLLGSAGLAGTLNLIVGPAVPRTLTIVYVVEGALR